MRSPAVTIGKIQEAVSGSFGLTVAELVSPRRSQAVAYPRQVAMYLSRELTDSSLPKIGKEFGGRDHTTVIHATTKITRLISEDRSVYNLVQDLTARIKQLRMTACAHPRRTRGLWDRSSSPHSGPTAQIPHAATGLAPSSPSSTLPTTTTKAFLFQ